jgi:hypothetical protein
MVGRWQSAGHRSDPNRHTQHMHALPTASHMHAPVKGARTSIDRGGRSLPGGRATTSATVPASSRRSPTRSRPATARCSSGPCSLACK